MKWIERAKSSLELAQSKNNKHIYYEDFCFQLQQAVEKAIKGMLIYFDVEPEFTHNKGMRRILSGKIPYDFIR